MVKVVHAFRTTVNVTFRLHCSVMWGQHPLVNAPQWKGVGQDGSGSGGGVGGHGHNKAKAQAPKAALSSAAATAAAAAKAATWGVVDSATSPLVMTGLVPGRVKLFLKENGNTKYIS